MIRSLALYTATWLCSIFLVWISFHEHKVTVGNTYGLKHSYSHKHKTIGLLFILFISLCFILYNVFITHTSVQMLSDRYNYYLNFIGFRDTPSIGLGFIIQLVKACGGEFNSLLYLTTLICFVITLIGFNKYEYASFGSLFLMFVSQYPFGTYINLKQCYASALACLFFALILREEKRSVVASTVIAAIACMFHATGYILIAMLFILKMKSRKHYVYLMLLLLIIATVSLRPIALQLSYFIAPLLPSLNAKIVQYFSHMERLTISNISISFLKGIPYYCIPVLGLLLRKHAKNTITSYDKMLIISAVGACSSFLSIYNVWFGRFLYLFMLPMFVFFGALVNTIRGFRNRMLLWSAMIVMIGTITYRYLILVYINFGGF